MRLILEPVGLSLVYLISTMINIKIYDIDPAVITGAFIVFFLSHYFVVLNKRLDDNG